MQATRFQRRAQLFINARDIVGQVVGDEGQRQHDDQHQGQGHDGGRPVAPAFQALEQQQIQGPAGNAHAGGKQHGGQEGPQDEKAADQQEDDGCQAGVGLETFVHVLQILKMAPGDATGSG